MTREPGRAPPRHAHGDLTSLAPHERLPEILVVLEGPVSPQDEVGRLWMDRYTWPGRGLQAGNVTGIIAGRKGKGQRGQVGYSTYVQVMVLLGTTQSHKEWWSGPT